MVYYNNIRYESVIQNWKGESSMTHKYEKLLFLREYVTFQLALENAYHDTAKQAWRKMHMLLDKFYSQKRISGFYYRKQKKMLKRYDIMYAGLEIRRTRKGWNRNALLLSKPHFGND